jgi:hypothetical protein
MTMSRNRDRWSHADTPSAEQNASIQAGINSAMADVMRTRNYNPQNPWPTPKPEPKKPGSGFVDPRPLEPNPMIKRIDDMVNFALPHGKDSKAD